MSLICDLNWYILDFTCQDSLDEHLCFEARGTTVFYSKLKHRFTTLLEVKLPVKIIFKKYSFLLLYMKQKSFTVRVLPSCFILSASNSVNVGYFFACAKLSLYSRVRKLPKKKHNCEILMINDYKCVLWKIYEK